jgi:hypothetical protein
MFPEISSDDRNKAHSNTTESLLQEQKFYETQIESINLESKEVVITHSIGKQTNLWNGVVIY